MPIEHFLIAIMQISFSDWIEKTTAGSGREITPTDIFQPTLRNFFLKHSLADNVFCFYDRGSFLVLVMHKKFTIYAAKIFCARSTDVLLWPKLAFPIYLARKTLAHLSKKIFANRIHAYFIQWLNRKLNSWQRSWNRPDWYFSANIPQFFFKNARWQIMFFYGRGSFLVLVLHKKFTM